MDFAYREGISYFPNYMDWTKPNYSASEVDIAGDKLIDPQIESDQRNTAIDIINNWRASHYFPLNTFQIGLRRKAKEVDKNSLVAQRIKRLPAIEFKLRNLRHIKLSEMQDIGGCRAIVKSVPAVKRLVLNYKASRHRHELIDYDDYITEPKKSGYRGYHLIYRYKSDENITYNRLKVEIQLRSKWQHIWATAVETAGYFTKQALKASHGKKEWLRFFALMSSAIALSENCPTVPKTPSNINELQDEIRELVRQFDIITKLETFGVAIESADKGVDRDSHYALIVLDIPNSKVKISHFSQKERELGFNEYSKIEKEISALTGVDAVFVSTDSFRQLKRAYPNYFLDTKAFVELIKIVLK